MPIDFYFTLDSPPCRLVQMTATALGVSLNPIPVDLEKGEHKTPEFLEMNPQHTVPTIKDGDLVLWESRPIIAYLVNKYGKDDHLYPNDPVKRALVDQRLYFDMGTLYQRFLEYYFPQIMEKTPADPEKYKKLQEAFGFLNEFLNGHKFAAGDDLTVADLSLMVTVSSLVDGGANRSLTKYPNVQRWYTDCKITIPEYEKSNPGLDALRPYFVDLPAPVED